MPEKIFEQQDFFTNEINQNCRHCGNKIQPDMEYGSEKCKKSDTVWHGD